jgi:NADPH:quinone reductase
MAMKTTCFKESVMKALLCKEFGLPETLVLEEIAAPIAQKGEVIVDVAYAALNFFDTLVIENKYQFKPALPFSIAAEIAGVVSALGEGVTGFKVGDKVAGYTPFGGAREQVAIAASELHHVLDGLSLEKAAGLHVTYGTTIHALKDRGELKPGETLAVLGASGGVGLAAVEIGKAMGANVIACCSSQDKVDFCLKAGADLGLNYGQEDLKEGLKRLTGGKGVDVLYDPVGDKWAEPAVRSMAWKGRYLVVGFAGGDIPRIPLNLLLLKGCDLRGVFWGEHTKRERPVHTANMNMLYDWARSGKISAHVDRIYPLAEASDALWALKRREIRGKAVLKI